MILGLGYLGGLIFDFRWSRVLLTIKCLGLAFLGTLCTPYGSGVWQTFFSKMGHVDQFRSNIVEFEPLTLIGDLFPYWAVCAVLFAAVCLKNKKIARCEIAVTGAFLLLGAYAVKFLPFAALASMTFILKNGTEIFFQEAMPFLKRFFGGILVHFNKIESAHLGTLGVIFLILLCAALFVVNVYIEIHKNPVLGVFPRQALDFVIENHLDAPILCDFNNGGYLMYRLSDPRGQLRHPVAIDGRTNVLPRDVTRAYYRMEQGHSGWKHFIELYRPGTIVWPARAKSPLPQLLREGGQWCEAFHGGDTTEGYSVFTECNLATDKRLKNK